MQREDISNSCTSLMERELNVYSSVHTEIFTNVNDATAKSECQHGTTVQYRTCLIQSFMLGGVFLQHTVWNGGSKGGMMPVWAWRDCQTHTRWTLFIKSLMSLGHSLAPLTVWAWQVHILTDAEPFGMSRTKYEKVTSQCRRCRCARKGSWRRLKSREEA